MSLSSVSDPPNRISANVRLPSNTPPSQAKRNSMPVELIITQGSNAGTVAAILPGYYLVGRHKECQIRPKSSSVSRRHCLLLHNDDGVGALDLKSTGGTYVNGQRLAPHQWRVLCDGDLIRFGKVEFNVSIARPDNATSIAPESWQNDDVASFLDDEDQREIDGGSAVGVDTLFQEPATTEEKASASGQAVEVDPQPKKRPPRKKIDHSQYKRPAKKSIGMPNLSLRLGGDADWRLIGLITIVCLVFGLLSYQAYRFTIGPSIEVRENLD